MVRVGIAGTGFIGAVHARSARLAGAHLVGVAASTPAAIRAGGGAARRRARVRVRRGARHRGGRRRRAHLHAEPPPRAARRGRARRRQARDLREAARARRRAGAAPDRRGVRGGPARRRSRSSTGTTRRSARRASASAGGDRPGAPDPRHLPAGLAAPPGGRQLARRRGPRRRLAGVRRHRLALVRPRRVRRRPAHHAALRAHDDRRARPRARRGPRGVRARRRLGRAPERRDRGRGHRAVRDRRRRGRLDGHQPDLRGPQEPAVARARRRGGVARVRPGGAGVAVGRPARVRHADQARPGVPVRAGGAPGHAPGGPSAGLRGLLRRVRRRGLRRDRGRRAGRRHAACSPTACARRRSPRPC